jgi:hypothetical protein
LLFNQKRCGSKIAGPHFRGFIFQNFKSGAPVMKNLKALSMFVATLSAFTLMQSCTYVVVGHGSGHSSDWHWHHGGWHHGNHWLDSTQNDSAQELAQDFGIQKASASAILNLAESNLNEQNIAGLGLQSSDLMALASLQMPSKQGIEQVATSLNEAPAKIQKLARSFVTDVKTQMSDVTSEYWQDCIRSGHWTTPENITCSQTWWSGCSPDTGATACEVAE